MRRPEAPSAFRVAMVSRRRSRWLFTALPTPTPPTSSAVRPTMARNCVKRSTLRSSCGEALLRLRISQPASGNARPRLRRHRFGRRVAGCRWRAGAGDSASAPGCPAAAGRWRATPPRSTMRRGPKPMPPASLSGSLASAARISNVALPMVSRAPCLMPSRVSSTGSATAPKTPLRSASAADKCAGRIEHRLAEQRIGTVDRLHLDQRQLCHRRRAPWRAWSRRSKPCRGVEERPFVRRHLVLDERERQIAAEDDLALPGQPAGEAGGQASRRRRSPCCRARWS